MPMCRIVRYALARTNVGEALHASAHRFDIRHHRRAERPVAFVGPRAQLHAQHRAAFGRVHRFAREQLRAPALHVGGPR